MSILRTKLDLVVYDQILQTAYTNKYLVGSIPEVTIDNGDILASFMSKTLTKDEYFNIMDTRFGPYVAGELINYYNVLYDKEINKVYDLTKVGPEGDRILDKSAWNSVLEEVAREKNILNLENMVCMVIQLVLVGKTSCKQFMIFVLKRNYVSII